MAIKQELRKALDTSTTNGGNNLLPYDLEPALNEELLKLQPLAELIPVVPAGGKTHEFTLRTSHPMGWFEGEATGANNQSSTYTRKSTMLKIQRIWGSVTGFAQAMDEPFIDALTTELEGSLEGMSNILEFGCLWGASDDLWSGDAYQYSGLMAHVFKNAPSNVIDAGGKISLDALDQAVAKVSAFRQSRNDPKMWMMGLRMRQIVDGLQTRVSMPLTQTVLGDGRFVMANYFNAPILETDFVVPEATTTSPAATATQGDNAEGTLAAATYTYQIASVTAFGEQVAGTASAGIVADATHLHIHVTWTHDDNARLYYIFRKKDAGAFQLLDIIPALTYKADGALDSVVEEYIDKGAKTPVAVEPLADGEQNILLINRSPERGVAFLGKVDDMGRKIDRLFSYVELARVKDTYDYMIKGYLGLRVKYTNTAMLWV